MCACSSKGVSHNVTRHNLAQLLPSNGIPNHMLPEAHKARLRAAIRPRNSPVLGAERLIPGLLCACSSEGSNSWLGLRRDRELCARPYRQEGAGEQKCRANEASVIRQVIAERHFQPRWSLQSPSTRLRQRVPRFFAASFKVASRGTLPSTTMVARRASLSRKCR